MTTPDKFIQGSLGRFDSEFPRLPIMPKYCVGTIKEFKSFLTQELKKAYQKGKDETIKDFKLWLKGRNINAREKDMIRGYLNSLTSKREEEK